MRVDVGAALAHLDASLSRACPGYASDHGMAAAARALSLAYTETRAIEDDAAADLAYLAHFGPRAIVAVGRALAAVPRADGPVRVADLGAGSGASALAWAYAGATELTLVERSRRALDLAGRLLDGCPVARPRLIHDRLDNFTAKEVTHVSAAFVVGELGGRAPEEIPAFAATGVTVVLVDAGDRPRARALQQLRDRLVVRDDVAVHGPCPHRAPCPALMRERDWCHDRVPKALPDRLAAFARLVGRDDEAMSLSWLAYSTATTVPAPRNDDVVVIGEPRREKGRTRLPVCGGGGLRFVQVLHRDKALARAIEALPRGTRLVVAKDGRQSADDAVDTVALRAEAAVAFASANAAVLGKNDGDA